MWELRAFDRFCEYRYGQRAGFAIRTRVNDAGLWLPLACFASLLTNLTTFVGGAMNMWGWYAYPDWVQDHLGTKMGAIIVASAIH